MMSELGRSCVFNKNYILPIFDKHGQMLEKRTLNLTIHNMNDSVDVKIRDSAEYSFNYTTIIDLAYFEIMRNTQSLDINFTEFKTNLLEMLQQFEKGEMFLKCVRSSATCTLVFYGKSKIKSIIYLTMELQETNQREILNELINNLQRMQELNETLKRQVANYKMSLSEKDAKIIFLNNSKMQLQNIFQAELKQIEVFLNTKVRDTEVLVLNKTSKLLPKFAKLLSDVEVLKRETYSKSECNNRLIKSLENLRVENAENEAYINRLKNENNAMHVVNCNQERNLNDLRKTLDRKETEVLDLQRKNEELRSDLEKATIVITQKKATVEELSKDLVQANQMLVNFNNYYDGKIRQVEELQSSLDSKQKIIDDQRQKYHELLGDFDNYKNMFNKEGSEKLKHDLLIANNRVDELEAALRKANKINTLLTEKVNQHQKLFNK